HRTQRAGVVSAGLRNRPGVAAVGAGRLSAPSAGSRGDGLSTAGTRRASVAVRATRHKSAVPMIMRADGRYDALGRGSRGRRDATGDATRTNHRDDGAPALPA